MPEWVIWPLVGLCAGVIDLQYVFISVWPQFCPGGPPVSPPLFRSQPHLCAQEIQQFRLMPCPSMQCLFADDAREFVVVYCMLLRLHRLVGGGVMAFLFQH